MAIPELSRPAKICIGCWQHMRIPVPLRGIAAMPFRIFGIRPSRMNPNTCTICELMFSRIMKARKLTIDATILFADVRDSSGHCQDRDAPELPDRLVAELFHAINPVVLDHYRSRSHAPAWSPTRLPNTPSSFRSAPTT